MMKRLLCLIMAATILCSGSISYAGNYDTEVHDYGYNVTADSNVMRISFNTDLFNNDPEHHLTDLAGKTLLTLKKYDADHPLINYFDPDVKNRVKELLPEGSDLNGLARYELLSLDAADFEITGDDKDVKFKFPITCKEGTQVVALNGLSNNDSAGIADIDAAVKDIKWIPLKAEEDHGEVTVHFTAECLEQLKSAKEDILTIMALRERAEPIEIIKTNSVKNPSITTNNFGYSVYYDSKIMYIDFRIELPRILTKLAEKVLEKLKDHIKNGSVISFFNEVVKQRAAALLPVGYNLDKLMMYEFVSLKAKVFDFSSDDVFVSFTFPTKYKNGTILIALIGVKDPTNITAETNIDVEIKGIKWLPLAAEVINGQVRIKFTRESLFLIDAADDEIMLAILSDPI